MTTSADLYARLAAPFALTHTDTRGGVEITYLTGEQVVSRLNEVLGVDGWTWRVLSHEFNTEADEMCVLGELVARFGDTSVTRHQFGSQKVRRGKATGVPLDLGFDLKGATTDAMKKCASLIGIGLYLSHKEPQGQQQRNNNRPMQQQQRPPQQQQRGQPANAAAPRPMVRPEQPAQSIKCRFADADGVVCDKPLEEVTDNGLLWSAIELANESQKRFKRPYCWEHYRTSLPATKAS